jgi:hypothetical protein
VAPKSATARRTEQNRTNGKRKKRQQQRTEQRILIRRRDNLEHLRLGVIPEPAPPAALNPSRGRIELRLERIDRAKVALERGLQLAVLETAAALLRGREVLPEERVVDVACGCARGETVSRRWGVIIKLVKLGDVPPPLNLSAAWSAIFSRVDGALTYDSSAALRPFT